MQPIRLRDLELMEGWFEHDTTSRSRTQFPITPGTGAANTNVVYFELDPGNALGTHTDSLEEVVLILSGTVEASINDDRGELSTGEMVLIPPMAPHNVRNIGTETARCLGFFSGAHLTSTFEQRMMPVGARAFSAGQPVFDE